MQGSGMGLARSAVCTVVVCALTGCAGKLEHAADLPLPASDYEVQVVSDAYVACIVDSARMLDDGKDNVIALALKILPICEMQLAAVKEAVARGSDPFSRRAIQDNYEHNKEILATSIVRRVRLARELGP
jgi:hypothetical protein